MCKSWRLVSRLSLCRELKARETPFKCSSSFCNVGKVSASGQMKSGVSEQTSAHSEVVHCPAGQTKAIASLQGKCTCSRHTHACMHACMQCCSTSMQNQVAGHPHAVLHALQVQGAYLREAARLCRPGKSSDALVLSVCEVAHDCMRSKPVPGLLQAERPS